MPDSPKPYHRCGVRMQRAALTIPPACMWAPGLAFSLPDTLNQLLVPYFTMGRAQLIDSPFALVDPGRHALTKTSISSHVHSMLSKMDPSFPRIHPSLLRHIFVHERRSRQRAEEPHDAAAVQVMGNSTQAWSKNYDMHFDVREAQAAVIAMQTWRQHPLAKQQPVLVEAPAEEGGVAMSASDGSDTERLYEETLPCQLHQDTLP